MSQWLPESIIVNSTITLRVLQEEDAEMWLRLVNSNADRLNNDFSDLKNSAQSLEVVQVFLRETVELFRNRYSFLYGLFYEGQLVGMIACHNYLESSDIPPSLAFWIDEGSQGKGIMKQALSTFINALFVYTLCEGVMAFCQYNNRRACSLMQRLGFTNYPQPQYPDHYVFARMRSEHFASAIQMIRIP